MTGRGISQKAAPVLAAFCVLLAACTGTKSPSSAGGESKTAPAAISWSGQKSFGAANDWEPAIAADPTSPYVYILTTQYGQPPACPKCPKHYIAIRISNDGGKTFGPDDFLCGCIGERWQADPNIEVAGNGTVFATWLTNSYTIVTSSSLDHGNTWTKPKNVIGKVPWGDHPWTTVSADGQDVYIGFNHRDNYQVSSHDGGQTWSQPIKTNPPPDNTYYFAESGVVLLDGTVVFADTAYGCCPYNKFADKRPQTVYAIRSEDGGATWEQVKIATSAAPPLCLGAGCPKAQYGSLASIASDGNGNLVMAYNSAAQPHGGQQVFAVASTDEGKTWSDPQALSSAGDHVAAFPAAAGGPGVIGVMWSDDSLGGVLNESGPACFATWYRQSSDGGATWSPSVSISSPVLHSFAGRLCPTSSNGGVPSGNYGFFYGDYGDIAFTNTGKAIATWGESNGYNGPGLTVYNSQV